MEVFDFSMGIIEFDYELARLVELAENGEFYTKGNYDKATITSWNWGNPHYPIEGTIIEKGQEKKLHWNHKGEAIESNHWHLPTEDYYDLFIFTKEDI